MYFLEQLKLQFSMMLASYEVIPEGPGSGGAGDGTTDLGPTLSEEERGKLEDLNSLKAEIDAIQASETIVRQQVRTLGMHLERIASGDEPGLSPSDPEYIELRARYDRLIGEYEGLADEGETIQQIVRIRLNELEGTVDEQIDVIAGETIDDLKDRPDERSSEEIRLEELATQRSSYEGVLNEKLSNLPSYIDREEVDRLYSNPIRELLETELTGETIEERVESSEQINAQILQAFENFDSFVDSNTPEVIYTTLMLQEMLENGNGFTESFRELFFQIIGEEVQEGDLGGFANHERVLEILGAEGDEFSYNIAPLLVEFDEIDFPEIEGIEDTEKQSVGEDLAVAIANAQSLARQMGIIHRDIQELESGDSFIETRMSSAHAYYESLVRDGDNLTELGEALASNAGNLPEFEDLRMEYIQVLIENDVDLTQLFLVNAETATSLESGELQEGSSYVVNFHANEVLQRQMDFSFINTSAAVINVDGVVLTLRTNTEHPQGVGYYDENGNRVQLLDGSRITVVSMREPEDPRTPEINTEVQTRIREFADRSGNHRAFVEAAYAANPDGPFEGLTLPAGAGFIGHVLAVLLSMYYGRQLRYDNATGNIVEVRDGDPDGSTITNREVVDGYLGSMELGSLSAEFESSSQGPYAYNPDDNGHGPSYGTYQMNSEVGVYRSFIQRHGIGEGREAWMAAIEQYGEEEFQRMEHEHIQRMNYDPMMNRITVPGKENFTMAMKNVIWSIAVQHGPGNSRLNSLINNSGVTPGDIESEARLINALYDERGRIWPAGINSRYNRERANALAMLEAVSIGGVVAEGGIYDQNLPEVPDNITSFGVERSASGTTLCSRTARRNLDRLGVRNINQGSSARASFEMYPSEVIQPFPPRNQVDARVADFYLDASANNAQYGHRVAAFQRDGQWYVLDPYYLMGRAESQRNHPIPAEDYIDYMARRNPPRNFWGAAYFR